MEEGEELPGEAGTLSVTVHEYLVTSDFLAFSFLYKCFYTVAILLPLYALVLVPLSRKSPCHKRSQKQS